MLSLGHCYQALNRNHQLEYDTDNCGDFAPLSHVHPEKKVVLGLVTTKHGKVCLIISPRFSRLTAVDAVTARGSGVDQG
jgi:hypothetical protein